MPSPFPGMDPFLESQHYWPDFHSRFLNSLCEAVSDGLPGDYEARLDERVQMVEVDRGQENTIRPDVAVLRHGEGAGSQEVRTRASRGAATLDAVMLPLPVMDEVKETRINILHRPERTLVAVVELLSPANKSNPGRGQNLAKRTELILQQVHLVEMDLLVAGTRLPMGRPLPRGDYHAIVARSDRRAKAEVYSWMLRDKLPTIPIPLLNPDGDVFVDLAAVFGITYEQGRYARSVDYSAALELPLDEQQVSWAMEMAKSA